MLSSLCIFVISLETFHWIFQEHERIKQKTLQKDNIIDMISSQMFTSIKKSFRLQPKQWAPYFVLDIS